MYLTFMKMVILFWAAIWLFDSCNSKPDRAYSVFVQQPKEKRSLIKQGFTDPVAKVLDSVGLPISAEATKYMNENRQKWSNNLLTKRINDTDVTYTFRGEELIGIQILVNHADPTKLINLLDSLGFERVGPASGPRQVFVNKEANIRYEALLVPDQAIFTERISRDGATGASGEPVPPTN